ncbi:MAG: MMPL family transporter, partial [Pseudomonadota bacterium]
VIKRRIADVLLSLLPLVLAASMTIAIAVLIGKPFNFANVIALPLLFALGVCSAVHMVWRQRQVQHGGPESLETAMSVEDTTTPKAIILSALTTLASFGSLAISPHPGTASMGLFLMIAIAATLLTTLVFLPALMSWWQSQQARKRRAVREAQP